MRFFTKAILFLLFTILSLGLNNLQAEQSVVFEGKLDNFSRHSYYNCVEKIFSAYEAEYKKIKLGKFKKVALKVYTNSGAGLATPTALVEAVIIELEKRGYERKNIAIVDINRQKLRDSGFLPKYGELKAGLADNFKDCPVYDLDSGKYFDDDWFYDNQMPAKVSLYATQEHRYSLSSENMRKSYLPVPLFLNVDFWINLPVATDMESIKISGALANASIWNMSNNERFFSATANAPIAVAEVMAIPELKESLLLNIMSFEHIQVIGGSVFNHAYVASDKKLIASADPCVIDRIAFDFLNIHRKRKGFDFIEELPVVFEYCKQVEVGQYDLSKVKFKAL
ncbi:MAG: DUF362 domain-containing protein [Opitutales bacterium]